MVGISGYGGSGKSTLARRTVGDDPSMVRMRGDDFLDPSRSHRRSPDWDGVERVGLVHEVLRETAASGETPAWGGIIRGCGMRCGCRMKRISTGISHRDKLPRCSTRIDDLAAATPWKVRFSV